MQRDCVEAMPDSKYNYNKNNFSLSSCPLLKSLTDQANLTNYQCTQISTNICKHNKLLYTLNGHDDG